jgi:hypothetical protein
LSLPTLIFLIQPNQTPGNSIKLEKIMFKTISAFAFILFVSLLVSAQAPNSPMLFGRVAINQTQIALPTRLMKKPTRFSRRMDSGSLFRAITAMTGIFLSFPPTAAVRRGG